MANNIPVIDWLIKITKTKLPKAKGYGFVVIEP